LLVLCDELQDWSRLTEKDPKRTKDTLCLREIEVINTKPVSVRIYVKASKRRIKELEKALTNRLYTGDKLSVAILNIKGNLLFSLKNNKNYGPPP
jgi:hypothetical protein